MAETRILHLETATNICSVALSEGFNLIAIRETDEDRSHGSVLTVFMEEVLSEAGLSPTDVDAISVSMGPGSYTGLRIGVSVAKGFAYGNNIPLIGISTLKALSGAALNNPDLIAFRKKNPSIQLCPLIDARRMEVYTAMYAENGEETEAVSAKIIEENSFNDSLNAGPVVFFGNGSDKIATTIKHKNAHFISGITPSARYMIPMAMNDFLNKNFKDTAYFEPFYLKDFVATIPRKKVI